MFQDPKSYPYVVDNAYRGEVNALLALPGVEDDILGGAEIWIESTEGRNRYTTMRQEALAALQPGGAGLSSIWNGDGSNRNALLTVFRHHDSATVKRGWLGQKPFTLWWMDYPLFERSYYNLIVNFDVFGNVAHQAQTRLYFDLIRNGAEQNLLRLLPPAARQDILDSLYAGSGQLKLWFSYQSIDMASASAVAYETESSGEELADRLLALFEMINATPDPINRGGTKAKAKGLGNLGSGRAGDAILAALADVPAAQMPAIAYLPDASILQVVGPDDRLAIYSR